MNDKLLKYLKIYSAYAPKAIPKSGGKFTFSSRKSGLPQIWTLNDNNEAEMFCEFDDTVINIHHSPDGKQSIICKDHNGNEKEQYYLVKHDDSERKPEVLIESLAHFHHFGGWSKDGKQIVYSSNRRASGLFDIFVMNVETKEAKSVYACDGFCTPVSWLPGDQQVIINIPKDSLDNNLFVLDVESGEITSIVDENNPARYSSFTFAKEADFGYALTDVNKDFIYISKFNKADLSKHEPFIVAENWDIESFKVSSDESKIVYTVNEGGYYKLHAYDVAAETTEVIDGFPSGIIESIAWLTETEFIFGVNSPTCPGDIWKYSFETKAVERLTHFGENDDVTLFEPELVSVKSFDGLEIPYFYYAKDDQPNKPAVFYVHGGPTAQTRAEFNYYVQYLTEQGFAVVAPNVRGSSGYGRKYILSDDVRLRMDTLKDIEAIFNAVVRERQVDADNVGIVGRSYGGFMVNAAVTHYPHLWNAAASIVGISSYESFMKTTGEYRRKLRGSEYGTIENDLDFFHEIDPIHLTNNIKTPLLVFHGLNDSRVPVTESIQLVMDLKEKNKDVHLTIFEDEGHFTEKIHNHIDMIGNICKFMEEKLN